MNKKILKQVPFQQQINIFHLVEPKKFLVKQFLVKRNICGIKIVKTHHNFGKNSFLHLFETRECKQCAFLNLTAFIQQTCSTNLLVKMLVVNKENHIADFISLCGT